MLKDLLTLTPVLTLPSGDERYIVYCDASRVGLGRVLMQNEKGIMKAHFLLLIKLHIIMVIIQVLKWLHRKHCIEENSDRLFVGILVRDS